MPKQERDRGNATDGEQNQWVLIAPEAIFSCETSEAPNVSFCKLRHPKTEEGAIFLFSSDNRQVFEVLQHKREFGSWIIEQTIQKDSSLLISTPVDPLFLSLPYLIKSAKSGKFMTIDQIVQDEDYPECTRLHSCDGLNQLYHMCDMRGDDDFKAYKYSQDKTLSWLQAKVEQLADELEKRKVHVAGGAVVATYVKSKKDDNTKRDDYLRFACGIVSDYLPLELGKDLKTHLNIPEPSPVKSSPSSEPPAKKVRLNGDVTPSEDYSKAVDGESKQKEVKLTAKQKQLSKVDKTGMKSISSFFSPKTKK